MSNYIQNISIALSIPHGLFFFQISHFTALYITSLLKVPCMLEICKVFYMNLVFEAIEIMYFTALFFFCPKIPGVASRAFLRGAVYFSRGLRLRYLVWY